ncbi:FixH family protein [Ammoniphilus sp. CFH 90114]|uniref:FixH family protein n=1 Tax=Ammoniphilus sp. CFH 90114 TaxID=2493665 RepID=UPI0013E984DD|nr:FixH family protein [Ammoniphilus sp. CFH 90114]
MRKVWISLVAVVVLLMTACSQGQGTKLNDIEVSFNGAQAVVPTGQKTLYTVELKDKDGKAIDVEKVYLYMNMNMMNHPTEGTMKRVNPGTYQLELPLAMAGEWYAHVTITEAGVERKVEGFTQQADGDKHMELMKGYHADEQK